MIAQLLTTSTATSDNIDAVQAMMNDTRKLDGCESIYLLSGDQDGLAIVFWRDQPSLDAAIAKIQQDIQQAKDRGIGDVTGMKTYEVVATA